ncbi:DUF1998 domain-containing protein [Planococcus ruber]|uniref:DUF1998 domain-containing protein n=1 Tax=Planococcus ruber TaxID=2027871 RepID=UPI001FED9451|nr:DUF1998 domain-containing protein [Planococcus ruber]MCJ1909967.1 hypothetical protein [Planococcus ruber]
MVDDFVRGRSQVMFKYLPGAVFYKDGRYFKVTNIVPEKITYDISRLREEVYRYVFQWTRNRDLNVHLFPKDPTNYYFSEIQSVEYELFPLVFYCEKCKNVHEYWDIETLVRDNKSLKCVFCSVSTSANLKQYPYVMVHENGDIKSLKVARNKSSTSFKDKYRGIRMNDTRSFVTATWYNKNTNTSLGPLGSNYTDLPVTSDMRKFMSGKHASDGDVFKPAVINLVNLNNEDLISRKENPDFAYIQLAALFNMKTINKDNYDLNFSQQESTSSFHKMLEAAQNETERALLLKLLSSSGQSYLAEENNVSKEISSISSKLKLEVDSEIVSEDFLLHEYTYSLYENDCSSINEKISEASENNNILQKQVLENAKSNLHLMGFSDATLLDKFPVITISPGYTRKNFNREEALLNPYRLNIRNSVQTVIPTMLNENEAIIFKVNPKKILEWLSINGLLDLMPTHLSDIEAEFYLYNTLKISQFKNSELAETVIDFESKDQKNVCAIVFQLIHTISHMMLNSGKTVIGLDIDSISEYIFTSSNAFAIYVSKLQGGGMGNLIAAFENDMEKWLHSAYEQSQLCLYDPVCKDHKAACHACSYLKFSCQQFNRGLNRSLLIGGHIKNKKVVGFLNRGINV